VGAISGIGNTAAGGTNINGLESGFFNTGYPNPFDILQGVVSGGNSGFLNFGSATSGAANLSRLYSP
jgi:hypothetical protein